MNECDWSERVAMLVDTNDPGTRAHVATCAACQQLLAELEADRHLLRSMPVPEMQVRVRRRPVVWTWAAAIAAALVIGVWLWPAEVERLAISVPVPPAPVGVGQASRPAADLPVGSPSRSAVRVARAPRREPAPQRLAEALEAALPPLVNPPAAADGDVVVAMKTEDPDVIIVLVGGDSNE
jgi:hypothetical protein